MKTYLLTLMAASFLSAGALYLASGKRFEKHIRYLASLLLLCTMLAPLPILAEKEIPSLLDLGNVPLENGSSGYEEAMVDAFSEAVRKEMTALIARKCHLETSEFEVSLEVSCTNDQLNVDAAHIVLKDLKALYQREKIRAELETLCDNVEFTEFG